MMKPLVVQSLGSRVAVWRAVIVALRLALMCLGAVGLIVERSQPAGAQAASRRPLQIDVRFPFEPGGGHFSGRLLVFIKSGTASDDPIVPNLIPDDRLWIAAREVRDVDGGATITIGPDDLAFPSSIADVPVGAAAVMAMLDVDHDANYRLLSPGDLRSPVVRVADLDAADREPVAVPLRPQSPLPPASPPANAELVDFVSPALSAFWGRPIHMRQLVVVPPGYAQTSSRYPVVYVTHGFGGSLADFGGDLLQIPATQMAAGKMPPMIWVYLEQAVPSGTHEFVDSVNTGPWGRALTRELIPELERRFRMDARPASRLLNGHSSGGWATAWLQVEYPEVFGGTWSTSPDPVDFHQFTNVDLYTRLNLYRDAQGASTPLLRGVPDDDASLERFAKREAVLGDYGGQFASFDWVFSPRGDDGRPIPLFNRRTGDIDQAIAHYWTSHFDLTRRLTAEASTLAPKLRGKLHFVVGAEDTFYLDRPLRRLEQAIAGLGYRATFSYVDRRNHFDLYADDLLRSIAVQMYEVARPRSRWKPTS